MTRHLDDYCCSTGLRRQFSGNSAQKDCQKHCKTPRWRCRFDISQPPQWRWKFGGRDNTIGNINGTFIIKWWQFLLTYADYKLTLYKCFTAKGPPKINKTTGTLTTLHLVQFISGLTKVTAHPATISVALQTSDKCQCDKHRTMFHIVSSCPQTILEDGLWQLHSADDVAVQWLMTHSL